MQPFDPFALLRAAPSTVPLTPQQSAFIESSAPRRALRACAGTGKTFTSLQAVRGLPLGLALAFNVRIKEELAKKLPPGWQALTMNGLGHRAWGKFLGKRITVERDKLYAIAKDSGFRQWRLWADVRRLVDHARAVGLVPPGCSVPANDSAAAWDEIFSNAWVDQTDELQELATRFLLTSIQQGWQGVVDYNDQLYLPVVFKANFDKFSTLFVDECQDLSPLQHHMVQASLRPDSRVLLAGDPHQAIYAWRGASATSYFDLLALTNSTPFPLTASFRCPQAVVAEAKAFVPEIEAVETAPEGRVYGSRAEPELTLSQAWLKAAPTAILCRNNAPLLASAFRLLRAGVGCVVLGRDFAAGLKSFLTKHEKSDLPSTLRACRDATNLDISIAVANEDEDKLARLTDRMESLFALQEGSGAKTLPELLAHIEKLFGDNSARITLSTVHKSKGLEWPQVAILAPELFRLGHGQEDNLAYVAVTRAQRELRYLSATWSMEP